MKECIFCSIASGEVLAKKIYEDRDIIAFLDINPANPGHALVVPRQHSGDIYSTDDVMLEKLIVAVKRIAGAVKEEMGAEGVNVVQNNDRQAGQIVAHIHFHIIPRFAGDHVNISYKRMHMDDAAMDEIAAKLRRHL